MLQLYKHFALFSQEVQRFSVLQYMAQQLTDSTIIHISLAPFLRMTQADNTATKINQSLTASHSNTDSTGNGCPTFLSHSFAYAM